MTLLRPTHLSNFIAMTEEEAKVRIEELSADLNAHNHRYYVLSSPSISDYDFDQLLKELQGLEEQFPQFLDANSPTKRVGGDITNKFEKVAHAIPMLSLGNTYSAGGADRLGKPQPQTHRR